jgi:hypothetical protein
MFVYLFPSSEVEIPNAKVSPIREDQGLFEGWEEGVIYIVEYSGHALRLMHTNSDKNLGTLALSSTALRFRRILP